jgi:hypothetical protein
MDESIRSSTILNSWMKIEGLIDRMFIIGVFQDKSKRAAAFVRPITPSAPSSTTVSRSSSVSTVAE